MEEKNDKGCAECEYHGKGLFGFDVCKIYGLPNGQEVEEGSRPLWCQKEN